MRRITAAALSLIILTGCSQAESGKALERSFSCNVRVTGDSTYSAQLERADNSGWNIDIVQPESASGIKLSYLADGYCSLELAGHTVVYERDKLPQQGVFDLITSAADMCIEGKGVTADVSGGRTVYTGNVRGMEFTAESENGSLTSMNIGGAVSALFEAEAPEPETSAE